MNADHPVNNDQHVGTAPSPLLELLRQVLRSFANATQTFAIYPSGHPSTTEAVRIARQRLSALLTEVETLSMDVMPGKMLLDEELFGVSETESPIANQLYRRHIARLTFTSGTTDAELQAEINGGYQTYTRHNMKEFAMADYLGTSGGSAGIHIYECDTTPDAQELYNDPDFLPHGSQSPAVGDLADMGSASGATTLRFARNQYYTEIVLVSADTQYAEQQAELLAAGIDSQMQED